MRSCPFASSLRPSGSLCDLRLPGNRHLQRPNSRSEDLPWPRRNSSCRHLALLSCPDTLEPWGPMWSLGLAERSSHESGARNFHSFRPQKIAPPLERGAALVRKGRELLATIFRDCPRLSARLLRATDACRSLAAGPAEFSGCWGPLGSADSPLQIAFSLPLVPLQWTRSVASLYSSARRLAPESASIFLRRDRVHAGSTTAQPLGEGLPLPAMQDGILDRLATHRFRSARCLRAPRQRVRPRRGRVLGSGLLTRSTVSAPGPFRQTFPSGTSLHGPGVVALRKRS